jgi:ATP-dependent DNA ligase
MAQRDVRGVRLLTRNGNDFAGRFPAIADATGAREVKSSVIDGEAASRQLRPASHQPPCSAYCTAR